MITVFAINRENQDKITPDEWIERNCAPGVMEEFKRTIELWVQHLPFMEIVPIEELFTIYMTGIQTGYGLGRAENGT